MWIKLANKKLTPAGEFPLNFDVKIGRRFEFVEETGDEPCLMLQHVRIAVRED